MGGDDFADLEHGANEADLRKPRASGAGGVVFTLTVTDGLDAGAQLAIDERSIAAWTRMSTGSAGRKVQRRRELEVRGAQPRGIISMILEKL